MAKKLWKILEAKARGEGGGCTFTYGALVPSLPPRVLARAEERLVEQTRSDTDHADGKVPRDGVRVGLAMLFHRQQLARTRARSCWYANSRHSHS